MRNLLLFLALFISISVSAQNKELTGTIVEENTLLPVEGATVSILPNNQITLTDERGRFYFKTYESYNQIKVTSIGHETVILSFTDLAKNNTSLDLRTQLCF